MTVSYKFDGFGGVIRSTTDSGQTSQIPEDGNGWGEYLRWRGRNTTDPADVPPPPETEAEKVTREAKNPLFRVLLKRMADKEGTTVADLLTELRALV